MAELNAKLAYTLRSITGKQVTITTRLGVASAREFAMKEIWKDKAPNIPSREGKGLSLISVEERT